MKRRGHLGRGAAVAALVAAQLAPAPAMLGPLGMGAAAAQTYRTVSCYARGAGRSICALPRGASEVRFVGPDRSMRCREGQTWGWSGTRLWVADGCGGNFEVTLADTGGGWRPPPGGGAWGDYAGRIRCSSTPGGSERCNVDTQQRVSLVRDLSGRCSEGRTWGYDARGIWVAAGCAGDFAYGYAGGPGGGSGGSWGGSGGSWGSGGQQGQGFAGELRCRSDRGRERLCSADARSRAMLVRDFSGGRCVEGQTWRAEPRGIRVRGDCDASFAYGFGAFYPDGWQSGGWQQEPDRGGGSNVGGIIAGGLLAAGLIALLSQAGKSPSAKPNASAARLDADLQRFPDRSRREAQACLDEAARQVGATGGRALRLDRVTRSEAQAAGGWRHEAELTATWPDHSQRMAMDCIASGDRVAAFDVR